MTYRLDSDILWSYSTIIDKETNIATAPALIPYWRKVDSEWTQNNKSLSIIINNKKKLIAWFVSNCRTYSKRERLVKELQKYIPVDIFGKCGDLKCKFGSTDCDEVLDTEYKFYLSFENSLCLDYVTEKFYNALKRNIVPVVFGGANYSKFAPPHSFIDAHGFPSVEELAKYLLNLNNTPNEYARYFWWRRFYTIKGNTIPFCDICHHLNKPVTQYRTQIYKSIDDYWHHNTCIDATS
ncbi:alpha-(1,3)-fucosyltransferase C-like [Teleopsis dalmanni]|uniref:alpha-(1,3)-fucosyltransferase C-like n=1 Tax=Teleopsis dalmanni TaxID=139649 RepID=UPI0018CD500D|nr:alpha-(1,3)-fucosyltransferase C-like [Teleopsis dalmanni]